VACLGGCIVACEGSFQGVGVIDNIFLLWPHGPYSLTQFLHRYYPIKFTWHTSLSEVTFLDVHVHLSHYLHTSFHVKTTNLQQCLHFSSCHPSSTKCFIPFALVIWGWWICSLPDDLHTFTINLTQPFFTIPHPTSNKCPLPSFLMPSGPPNLTMFQLQSPYHHQLSWPPQSQTHP
jgi:hypothetical protein